MVTDRQAVEVSPEEARFLRRFVRRALLPWVASVGALAALALVLAWPSRSAAPASVRVGPAPSIPAAVLAGLREELAAVKRRLEQPPDAAGSDAPALEQAAGAAARALEARLRVDFEARLADLEARSSARPAAPSREAAGDSAPASIGDLNSIRERLYNLEMRQDRKDQERSALQADVLARVYRLEQSAQSEASSRLENLETSEQRLGRLEARLFEFEQRASPPTAPAAPAPR